MTKKEKLLEKFLNNPTSISDKELVKIIIQNWGEFIREGKGSHSVFKIGNNSFPLPDWHSKWLNPKYKIIIKKLLFPDN